MENRPNETTKRTPLALISGNLPPVMSFALIECGVRPIRDIRIQNLTDLPLRGLRVSVSSAPALFQPASYRIERIDANATYEIIPSELTLLPSALLSAGEAGDAVVTLTLTLGEEAIASEERKIRLLTYDCWSGMRIYPETTPAFVTPEHPYVTELQKSARTVIKHWEKGAALTGYAEKEPARVLRQLAALFTALQCEHFSLREPEASYAECGQRIRLFGLLKAKRDPDPLELAILYAACMEAIGLHPILVLEERHAYVGAWLYDHYFSETVQDDLSQLTKRMAEGVNEISLIDVSATVSDAMTFDHAAAAAMSRLSSPATGSLRFAVDVRRARASGIRPLPPLHLDASGNIIFDFVPASGGKHSAAPTEPAPARGAKGASSEMTKLQLWERKLLDLSLRNTLLNFRASRGSVQLLAGHPEELCDGLASGGEFALLARPKELADAAVSENGMFDIRGAGGSVLSVLRSDIAHARMRSFREKEELASALTGLFRSAKTALEESGASTLFLALGFLRWYESDAAQRAFYAPLVLFPVELVRTSVGREYLLRAREDEPHFNVTLLEHLRTVFGISLDGLDPLPTEDGRVNLRDVFAAVRRAIIRFSRWEVEETAFLSSFSFANFIMYNDLRTRAEELRQNKVVSSLLSGRLTWQDTEGFLPPEELDERVSPVDLAAPLSADSSQLSAIHAAGLANKSFVLHGPPGTGKSQTITNMIANALYHGKSVLFIAEKMAALSVVQKRLEAIGISPFCLELHSNKAKKQDVLAQLDRTLQAAKVKTPAEFTAEAEHVRRLREQLSATMKTVHRPRPFGMSLYEAIVLYERYKDEKELAVFTEAQIKALTPTDRRRGETLLGQLRAAADAVGGVSNNPFLIYRRREYSQAIKSELAAALRKLIDESNKLQKTLVALARLIPLRNLHTYAQIHSVSELCKILAEINLLPDGLITNRNLPLYRDKIIGICRAGQRKDDLYGELSKRFTDGIFNFDATTNLQRLKSAQARNPIAGFFRRRKICRRISTFGKIAKPCRPKETARILEQIVEYQEAARLIRENNGSCEFIFGPLFGRGRCDFHMLERVFTQANEIIRLTGDICMSTENRSLVLVKIGTLTDEGMFAERTELFREVSQAFAAFTEAERELASLCAADVERWHAQPGWMLRQRGTAEKCLAEIDGLHDWHSYLKTKAEADAAGLGVLCRALESGLITTAELIPVYRRSLAYGCAVSVIDGDESLSSFSGSLFEEKIREYAEVSRGFETLTKQELASLLSSKIPNAMTDTSASSEIAILQRAIRSGGRGVSIRKLFDAIPNLLRRLCPCMLMSPISVAQYIDPSFPKFDLVIFDEASQLPTCEAVGAIARGKELIVVGDPKQLPPTSFFTSAHGDEDNLEKEDLESILDDCLALSMPEEHLLWHYRSRHESLIAFSNRQYYGNRLYTFPSPNDRVSRVRLSMVNGYYDRGKTKQNREEALAVVKEIKRRLSDPALAKQSIGVVTFSSVQQLLIEDLLESELAKNRRLEQAAAEMYEPIFVKNLENVQGDERDVIMFSVCYGPDREGQVTMNFGPLNREGGWRRLNVAASRARREMIVFSTLTPEDIDESRTTSDGVLGLRAFLEFARNGTAAITARPGDRGRKAGIAESVASALSSLGYLCDVNVGCSAYKIDVAIRDPLREGEYLLGILCDGQEAHGTTTYDRVILQDSILSSLGWKIYHLWALDWWDSPAKALERIRAFAEDAKLRPVLPDTPAPISEPTVFEVESKAGKDDLSALPIYTPTALDPLPSTLGGLDDFCSPINKTRIVMQIDKILRAEAPISRTQLSKRLLTAWGITRNSVRTERVIDEALNFIDVRTTRNATKCFYWTGDPAAHESFRIASKDNLKTRRDLDDIPPEELACAVRFIVEHQYSLLSEDLYREAAKLLGFTRCAPTMQAPIAEGIRIATEKGWVSEKNGRITIG